MIREKKFLVFELYAVLQAEKMILQGIKYEKTRHGTILAIFLEKEMAKDYCINLISEIKHEQSIGLRTKNNLVKEEGLDFAIQKVLLCIPKRSIDNKKWKVKSSDIVV